MGIKKIKRQKTIKVIKMEKLKPKVMALSLGIVGGLISLACLLFIALSPLEAVIKVSNSFMHGIDISSIAVKDTSFADSLLGFVIVVLGSMAVGYIFAVTYNWLNERVK